MIVVKGRTNASGGAGGIEKGVYAKVNITETPIVVNSDSWIKSRGGTFFFNGLYYYDNIAKEVLIEELDEAFFYFSNGDIAGELNKPNDNYSIRISSLYKLPNTTENLVLYLKKNNALYPCVFNGLVTPSSNFASGIRTYETYGGTFNKIEITEKDSFKFEKGKYFNANISTKKFYFLLVQPTNSVSSSDPYSYINTLDLGDIIEVTE